MSVRTNVKKADERRKKAHALIPGGCHTYAKGDDQYPVLSPGFISHGKGSHAWDVDGNEYIEYGLGNRAVGLGHAYEPVIKAAQEEMLRGANFTRPAPIEVACAEAMLGLIPGAEMVKFAKDGSTVTSAAVKLARAHTGRDLVGICQDHPFFSTADWFMGTTEVDAGIPQVIKDLTVSFRYDDVDSVRALFEKYPGRVACLILEPAKYTDPQDGYLHRVQELCREHGAVFILDEMITGFRWHNGGAQTLYDVVPDLSTFGKALGNGFAVSALLGRREIMELGGLEHDRERVFLLSTTHGAETHALAAGMETIRIYREEPVIEELHRLGDRLKAGMSQVIARRGLADQVQVIGRGSCLVSVARDEKGEASQGFRTLLLQEMIKRGVIAPSLVVSYSHTDADIDQTVDALDESLEIYARALEDGYEAYLVGRPSKVVYRRRN